MRPPIAPEVLIDARQDPVHRSKGKLRGKAVPPPLRKGDEKQMRIKRKKNSPTRISDLSPGDVFEIGGELHMVINPRPEVRRSVRMSDGTVFNYSHADCEDSVVWRVSGCWVESD